MQNEPTQARVITRRPANPNDKELLRIIHHRGYRDVVIRQFGIWDETRQDAYFEKNWTEDPIEVIECDKMPCGFIALKDHGDHLELVEILLLPEFQRQGIGSMIMGDIIAVAKARNITVRLHVLHENEAIALYRRLGFKETGRTATHIEMELEPELDSVRT